jgi:hypothetical protein
MLAAMHPSQMYAMSQIRMAEAQARARHARMVADSRPAPRRHTLLARLRRSAAPVPAAAPLAPAPKPAS